VDVSDQLNASAALPRRKFPWYARNRRLDGLPEPVWTRWRRKDPCPYREFNPGRPARSLVATLSELYRLFCISISSRLLQ